MNKANIGDFIQYRFIGRGGFMSHSTRRVIDSRKDTDGNVIAYLVERNFVVVPKDILTLIPMHEETETSASDVALKLSEQPVEGGLGGRPLTDGQSAKPSERRSPNFPLEAGQ